MSTIFTSHNFLFRELKGMWSVKREQLSWTLEWTGYWITIKTLQLACKRDGATDIQTARRSKHYIPRRTFGSEHKKYAKINWVQNDFNNVSKGTVTFYTVSCPALGSNLIVCVHCNSTFRSIYKQNDSFYNNKYHLIYNPVAVSRKVRWVFLWKVL